MLLKHVQYKGNPYIDAKNKKFILLIGSIKTNSLKNRANNGYKISQISKIIEISESFY